MPKKSLYLKIADDKLSKWKQLWQPKDASELANITGFTEGTIRSIFRRGTAPHEKVIRDIDDFYNAKIQKLLQL